MGWLTSAPETRDDSWTPWELGADSGGSAGRALGLVPFWAAVRHIVDFLSTLPVDGYRVEGDARVPRSTPALLRRLNDPGDQGVQSWIGQWAFSLAVHGNAVGWVTAIDGFGFPTSVRWVNRADWSFDENAKQWYLYGYPAPRDRVVHCPWIVPPGKTLGMSPLENFLTLWNVGLSAQEYADVRRGGGLPPATLKNTARTLDPAVATQIQARAVKAFASGKPFVTGQDWALEINNVPPNQSKFLETLQLTANQTAAIFGIDPREIGGSATESLTYATDESRSLNRANNMRPYLERFEYMLSRLLPEKQFIKLNVDATIRTDIKTRTEVIGAQIKDGRMSVNEARALEDRPPVPGGDFHNVPAPTADPTNRNGD